MKRAWKDIKPGISTDTLIQSHPQWHSFTSYRFFPHKDRRQSLLATFFFGLKGSENRANIFFPFFFASFIPDILALISYRITDSQGYVKLDRFRGYLIPYSANTLSVIRNL